jgi:hypothetical protein
MGEQVLGEEVDERGYIFTLCIMVVEALTARPPLVGRTPTERYRKSAWPKTGSNALPQQ